MIKDLTCPICGKILKINTSISGPITKAYWEAINKGIINLSDESVTAYEAICDDCGKTPICFSYEEVVLAATNENNFLPIG